MYSTYISVLRYFSLHKALPKCPLTVSKVSVVRLREVLVLLIDSVVTGNSGLKTGGTNVSVLGGCLVKSNFYNTIAQN